MATDIKNNNALLLQVTCIGWLAAKLISWPLWTDTRLLPTAPVFAALDNIPPVVHTILFAAGLLLMIALLFKRDKLLMIALLSSELLLCLLDQNRWQPWEYQYLFILLIFIINNSNPKQVAGLIAFILACTYFYSGLNKLNAHFLQTTWERLILHFLISPYPGTLPRHWFYFSGYLIGLTEIALGIALFFKKTQARAAILLIVIHVFILVVFGPIGLNINPVIWPWNLVMILYLYFVFLKDKQDLSLLKPAAIGWNKLILICWAILPAFSFVGWWDKGLSANLYGNAPKMVISVKDTNVCKPLKRFYIKNNIDTTTISLVSWAYQETNTPGYMNIRAYHIIQQKLQKQYPAAGLTFQITK